MNCEPPLCVNYDIRKSSIKRWIVYCQEIWIRCPIDLSFFFQGLYTIPSWKWGHFWFLFAEPVYVCFLTFVFDFLKRVRVSRDRYITNGKRLPIYTSDEPVDWLLEAWSLEIIETRDFVTKHVLRGWILQSKDIPMHNQKTNFICFFLWRQCSVVYISD